jgi:translation initiation factor IF-1
MSDKEEKVQVEGEVLESFRSGMHRVGIDGGHETLAYTSGKMRRHRIRIAVGDRVTVELSPYDLSRGRITYRVR